MIDCLAITIQMPLENALLMSVIGVAIVFAVLILLMGIIYLMGHIAQKSPALMAKLPKFGRKSTPQESATVPEVADGSCGELVLVNTTERDAAMIMAIVADSTNTPLNELRFKSIKRVD